MIFSKINVIERERFYAFVEPKMNQIHQNNQILYESYLMSHLDVWQSFIRTSIISELALNEVTWSNSSYPMPSEIKLPSDIILYPENMCQY